MTSLAFRVLDRHVIDGHADLPAIRDERGEVSYAQLLHDSSSLAGGLRHMGVVRGSGVAIGLSARERVVAVLACARLGAVPDDAAVLRLTGDPAALVTPDTEVPWDVLLRAGRTEPAAAHASDSEDYEALMRHAYPEIFATLGAGGTVT